MVLESLKAELIATLDKLPLSRQRQVVDFAKNLFHKDSASSPEADLGYGALQHLPANLSFEDMRQLRREISANLPREID